MKVVIVKKSGSPVKGEWCPNLIDDGGLNQPRK